MNRPHPINCTCKVTLEDGQSLVLEARYGTAASARAVVAPPHPVYGGTIDNPVVIALAAALRRAEVATFAFNYRGVDGSQGVISGDLGNAVQDYAAAADELARRAQGPLFATGYSFGAGSALLWARDQPDVQAALLIAPPVGMLHAEDLRAFAGKLAVVVGSQDEYAPLPELKQALRARPDAVLCVIPGETHFFHYGGLAELERTIVEQTRAWLG